MKYTFQILTNSGIIDSIVESGFDFSYAPFGFVSYRYESTCELTQEIIEDFWNCVDRVLENNNKTHLDYIRAVRAYDDQGRLYGEI